MRPRTLVIDGPYLVRRPFEAASSKPMDARLETCAGASAATILNLIDQYQPEKVYVAWEASGSIGRLWGLDAGPTVSRRQICSDYKATRQPWAAELIALVDELLPVLGKMGCINVCCEDEADDAIASVVTYLPGPHLIWSADKDMLQLVSDEISMVRDYAKSDKAPITSSNIVERTGLDARGWTAYLSLAGDSSDCIPNIPKVGDQRARRILDACPGILGALSALGHDTGWPPITREEAVSQASREHRDIVQWIDVVFNNLQTLALSWQLVILRPQIGLRSSPPAVDREAAAAWFAERGNVHVAKRLRVPDRDPWETEEDRGW